MIDMFNTSMYDFKSTKSDLDSDEYQLLNEVPSLSL